MPGALWCQEQGGDLHGKVFLDLNNNGVYEPHLGETGFPHRVHMELIDCSPEEHKKTCDLDECFDKKYHAYNPNNCGRVWMTSLAEDFVSSREISREYPRCPDKENGGCFHYRCQNCYGSYKIAAFLPKDDWQVSSVTLGDYRPGWSISSDPTYDGPVVNNFQQLDGYRIAESECFRMLDDMYDQVPFVNLLDLGLVIRVQEDYASFDEDIACSSTEDCPLGYECDENYTCIHILEDESPNNDSDYLKRLRS